MEIRRYMDTEQTSHPRWGSSPVYRVISDDDVEFRPRFVFVPTKASREDRRRLRAHVHSERVRRDRWNQKRDPKGVKRTLALSNSIEGGPTRPSSGDERHLDNLPTAVTTMRLPLWFKSQLSAGSSDPFDTLPVNATRQLQRPLHHLLHDYPHLIWRFVPKNTTKDFYKFIFDRIFADAVTFQAFITASAHHIVTLDRENPYDSKHVLALKLDLIGRINEGLNDFPDSHDSSVLISITSIIPKRYVESVH